MRAALSDMNVPVADGREEMAAADDASPEGLRSLHEKLEIAFPPAEPSLPPPPFLQSPFDASVQRQAALMGNFNNRIARLEDSAELSDLRGTMRDMCEAISGLAMEAERGANERDEKISALTYAFQAQLEADRARLDAVEARTAAIEAGSHRTFEDIRAAMREHEERMRIGDAHNEDLAYNMRMLKSELAGFNESIGAVRLLEERMEAGDGRHQDLTREASILKEELGTLAATAAAATRMLDERLRVADARHEDLSRGMGTLKGELLAETTVAMRGHQVQLEQAERAIGELKDRNTRAAERIEAFTDTLGSLGRKLDVGTERLAVLSGDVGNLGRKIETESSGAQLLAERLGSIEKWIEKSVDRERARAELHARLASTLAISGQD